MTTVSPSPRLTRGTHLGYALGSIGTAAFGTVPGLLLLYYLTDELGVAAGLAGLVVFAPKAWDVWLNPWIGSRSDRTESRWGPRRPWMLAGGLTLPPLFVLVADAELVAAAATIDPATLTVAEVEALLELAGVGGGTLPERMAPVHALVAALPRPVAERLLSGVLGRIYRPEAGLRS